MALKSEPNYGERFSCLKSEGKKDKKGKVKGTQERK